MNQQKPWKSKPWATEPTFSLVVNMLMNVKDMTEDFSSFIPKRIAREINEFDFNDHLMFTFSPKNFIIVEVLLNLHDGLETMSCTRAAICNLD